MLFDPRHEGSASLPEENPHEYEVVFLKPFIPCFFFFQEKIIQPLNEYIKHSNYSHFGGGFTVQGFN